MVQFDLEKKVEKVKFILEKRQLNSITAQVAVVLDISGSMQGLYARGDVQDTLQNTLPIALNMDDNGNLDVYTFSNGYDSIEPGATRENYSTYVNDRILKNNSIQKWGGTQYAPVLSRIVEDYGYYELKGGFFGIGAKKTLVPNSKSGYPILVYFFTDGDSSDHSETYELIERLEANNCSIYFNFVGIGRESFGFLRRLATKFSNCGFFAVQDLGSAADADDFQEQLLPNELVKWLK